MNKKFPRRVLGRGLSALIPAATQDGGGKNESGQQVISIDPAHIHPNPFQPRREFIEEEIDSLAESIKAQGLLQPILVRQKDNREYQIVSGERRFRALQRLGRDKIPCLVKSKLSDREMMEMALVENIQREDLNEIEKAEAYQKLLKEYNYTHDQLAAQVGKSRTAITNAIRLLGLSEEIRQMVRKNVVTMGHARALLSLNDEAARIALAIKIQKEELSVRETEKAVQQPERKTNKVQKNTAIQEIDPDIAEALKQLEYRIGTPVKLKPASDKSGKIEIAYFTEKDLTRIFDLLLPLKTEISVE
jgi:ParB family chromosome partitioning protein